MENSSVEHKNKEALQKAERKLYQILENSMDCFFSLNDQFCFDYVNSKTEAYFGVSRDELLGQECSGILKKLFGQEQLLLDQAFINKQTGHFESYSSLTERWIEFYTFPGENSMNVYFRDVTEKRMLEEELRDCKELQAYLLKLGEALRFRSNPLEIQAAALRVLGETLKANRVFYAEIHEEEDEFVINDNYVNGTDKLIGRFPLSEFKQSCEILRKGQMINVPDAGKEVFLSESERAGYMRLKAGSVICVPLIKEGKWVAALGVHQSTPRLWNDVEIQFLKETAERTWATVEGAYAEEALRVSEERLRRAVETARVVIWEWDTIKNQIKTSDNFQEVYGLSSLEAAEQGWNMVHPDDLTQHVSNVQKAAAQGGAYHSQFRVIRPDTKEIVWLEERAVSLLNEEGKIQKMVGAAIDITNLKNAEQALRLAEDRYRTKLEQQVEQRTAELRESFEHFRTLVNNTPDVITRWDKDLHLIYANVAFEKKLGVSSYSLYGKNSLEMGQPKEIALPWMEKLKQVFITKQAVEHYNTFPTVQGEAFFYSRIVPEYNPDGSVESVLAIARDITVLKNAENKVIQMKLAQQKEVLNVIIMAQEQERKRIGEELHDGVAQLLYGLHTRIQTIQTTETAKLNEIQHILKNAINDTRRVSFALVPSVLKDYGLEIGLKSLFQRIVPENIKLQIQITGLKERLQETLEFNCYRIVQELVTNIFKHSEATQGMVNIDLKNKKLHLRIEDNGKGFDPQKLNPMSMGIGLQSIKNRVELLKGKIKISSSKKGTVVKIILPVTV
jgi:PAS domain S-box-containing protein